MPVAARVISDVPALTHAKHVLPRNGMVALGAGRNMAAKRSGSTILNGRHHLQLWAVQVPDVVPSIGNTIGAEDIRNLQFWVGHGRPI